MPELKVFALKKLDLIVDEFWPEISEAIEKMYVLYSYNSLAIILLNSALVPGKDFPNRNLCCVQRNVTIVKSIFCFFSFVVSYFLFFVKPNSY